MDQLLKQLANQQISDTKVFEIIGRQACEIVVLKEKRAEAILKYVETKKELDELKEQGSPIEQEVLNGAGI